MTELRTGGAAETGGAEAEAQTEVALAEAASAEPAAAIPGPAAAPEGGSDTESDIESDNESDTESDTESAGPAATAETESEAGSSAPAAGAESRSDAEPAGPAAAPDTTPDTGSAALTSPSAAPESAPPPRRWFAAGIWRNRDFARLWWAAGISNLGSQVSVVAIPIIAVDTLHAGPGAMGLLQALGRLPFLLYLFAGVFVDRTARRPVLIGTDLGRTALLAIVIVCGITHTLAFWMLAVVITASMLLSVWFETASMSLLPSIIPREQLMAGNTRLETSRSSAQTMGPAVGGALVQALTAPVAMIADALSFLGSAALLRRIEQEEPKSSGRGLKARGIVGSLGEGLRFVFGHQLLRPLAIAIAVSNFVWAMELALYTIFVLRTVGLTASLLGLTLAAAGPGAIIGSLTAGKVRDRFGQPVAIIGGLLVFAASALLIPLAVHNTVGAVGMLMVAGFLMSAGGQICAVNVMTLRQGMTPNELQGRVNSAFRFFALGISPLGAVVGGELGSAIGIRQAMLVSVLGMFLAPLILLPTRVRTAGRKRQAA